MLNLIKKWNTLRNQILFIFLFVMMIVLLIVGILTYSRVSTLLTSNAEEQMQQTAVEANGRFESLFEQLNMVTKQVATNEDLQKLLLNELDGKAATFNERQSLMQTANTLQANADGIYSIELYTKDYKKILPLGDEHLLGRIDADWIKKANQAKGSLIWVGQDPRSPEFFLAMRRVSMMDRAFSTGGYLLIRINKNYFQINQGISDDQSNDYTILVDSNGQPIISNYEANISHLFTTTDSTIRINDEDYMLVKQTSPLTGWTLAILTPVHTLTKGITVLRTVIVISGIIGFIIFSVCSFFLSTLITQPIIKLTKTMQQASKGTLTMTPNSASINEINELNNTYNQLVVETNHLIQMVYEKELIRSRSELKALQAQINPHFLFNTLDSLYWSLEDKEEEELAELVLDMSELFRYTISHQNKNEWVTIREEIDHSDRYINIMQMRFGDRLQWDKRVQPEWEHVKIPKLLIQPLVENAILHGVGNTIRACVVTVTIRKANKKNRLRVTVEDNGNGIEEETLRWIYQSIEQGGNSSLKGNGIALANVHKRLHLYYQNHNLKGLEIDSVVEKGTRISFEIPINEEDNNGS
ncbi:sensor histidine kinase [Aquibacillus rhizosphaerae]|uniref:histidine kinase n=1 Tax=Aquibacillus rhizosphaerae TaxID=3051431 RepID=A0ABT7L354_9BACI|nr:sensor histidine kinase [Aquibacillus sp. LR5S19]MDL4840299.1 sensor histidine kinase [Aquibacillus sp. LR5S19]